ncbi:uncharacterized protein METZ01_LOCUS211967 [marine metagenome]|uniref:Uncharacterized protein n=1 Tax=marine metagenome TaxID=408172 RepID=A0A382FA90_9ZZZZ
MDLLAELGCLALPAEVRRGARTKLR